MRTLLRILGGILLALVVGIAGVLIAARFADGPWEIIAGGPFTTGEAYAGPEPDWSFVEHIATLELQGIEPARSRTTWVVHHDGRAFIPCGFLDTFWGRIWKQWPIEAERDGRAIARIDGVLYERHLLRVKDPQTVKSVARKVASKYMGYSGGEITSEPEGLWVFELAPRNW